MVSLTGEIPWPNLFKFILDVIQCCSDVDYKSLYDIRIFQVTFSYNCTTIECSIIHSHHIFLTVSFVSFIRYTVSLFICFVSGSDHPSQLKVLWNGEVIGEN